MIRVSGSYYIERTAKVNKFIIINLFKKHKTENYA